MQEIVESKRVFSTLFLTAVNRVVRERPALVCPDCRGEVASDDNEPCGKCRGKGWIGAKELELVA